MGKSSKVGKMRFYPMPAGWLDFHLRQPSGTLILQQNSSILTPYQRQAFIWVAIALVLGILLWLLSPVLTPFLLGAILAYILQPGVAWMVKRRVPRSLAALLMMLLFTLALTIMILLVLVVIQKEGPQLKQQVPVLFAHVSAWLQPKLAMLGLADSLDFATSSPVSSKAARKPSRSTPGPRSAQAAM
jgi:predicted PurR-regulated permease PerM